MASPGPVLDTYGTQRWFKDGVLHRDGGLPACQYANGDQSWFKDGKLHRAGDAPAIAWGCYQAWLKNGKLHRDVGPAETDSHTHVFYTHGVARDLASNRGETMVARPVASWSPVLCLI